MVVMCVIKNVYFVPGVPGIRLMEVRIPMHTVREQSARLECHYDLEGEALYAVKWYKDGSEFYRYVPRDNPPAQIFTLPGVTVDVSCYKYFNYFNVNTTLHIISSAE